MEVSKIGQLLLNLETEREDQRIKDKFDNLDIDALDKQIFENRLAEIIKGNEVQVRKSATLKHCHSLPSNISRDITNENSLNKSARIRRSKTRRKSFWQLSNLDNLKLEKKLSSNNTQAIWEASIGGNKIIAIQFYSCTAKLKKEQKNKIRLIKSLEHPHIVSYYGTGCKSAKEFYVFREFVNGGSLADFLQSGPMNEISASHVVYQLLLALKFLHENEIVHGNICPKKILLSTGGIIKLSGFEPSPDVLRYIPHYSAPEVVSKNLFTTCCDIWSIGCVVLELVCGKAPFSGLSPFDVIQQLKSGVIAPYIPDTVSTQCASFLESCWKLNPSERSSIDNLLNHKFLQSSVGGHSALLGFIRRKLYKKETSHGYLGSKQIISRVEKK